jgi:thiamine pyrophosphate-dependent acetolactate synthase large subunit-like protein
MRSGAGDQCEELAEICGGLLATTLPARGLFDHNPFSLGVAGGYSSCVAREMFAECDLVIAVGASLAYFTVDGGRLFPNTSVIQIDQNPVGLRHGLRAAELYVAGDASTCVEALISELRRLNIRRSEWRSDELKTLLASESDHMTFPVAPGTLDPRPAMAELDRVIPKDWDIVMGSGHNTYFYSLMRGRPPSRFHTARDFGAIGNGLAYAIGVAAAKPNSNVVLFDGDGGFLMHVQELETIRRHGLRILICVLNDGGYGAEFHKLRAEGLDDRLAIFGRGDLAKMAHGFGLAGRTVTNQDQFNSLLRNYVEGNTAEVWDIHISDKVVKPTMRPDGRNVTRRSSLQPKEAP